MHKFEIISMTKTACRKRWHVARIL